MCGTSTSVRLFTHLLAVQHRPLESLVIHCLGPMPYGDCAALGLSGPECVLVGMQIPQSLRHSLASHIFHMDNTDPKDVDASWHQADAPGTPCKEGLKVPNTSWDNADNRDYWGSLTA